MARSKNRIFDIKNNGRLISAQFELDNGEVVSGHFKNFFWLKPPSGVWGELNEVASLPPIQTLGLKPNVGEK